MNKLLQNILLFSLLLLSVTSGNEEAVDTTDAPDTTDTTTFESLIMESTTVPLNLTLITSTPINSTNCTQSDLVKQSPDTVQSEEADKKENTILFGLYVLLFFSGFLMAIALVASVIKKFRRYRQSRPSGDLVVCYVNHAFEDENKQIEYLPTNTPPMTLQPPPPPQQPQQPQQPPQPQHPFSKVMKLARNSI